MKIETSLYKHITWRAASLFVMFLVNILFARFYRAEGSGWVFYLFTINAFIIQFVGFSLESGVAYHTAKRTMQEGRLISFSLLWTLLATIITLIAYYIYRQYQPDRVDYPLLYPIAFVAGNILISFGNAIFYSKYNFVVPSAVAIVVNVLLVGLLLLDNVMIVSELPISFIPIYFYSFLFHGVVLFISLFVVSKEEKFLLAIPGSYVKRIFRYSAYAFMANLLFLGLTRIDYFFIKHYCTASDLGNYIQVSKIAHLFFVLPSMISTVVFPFVASGAQPGMKSRLSSYSRKLVWLYVGLCALLAATGYWLFPLVYGETFSKMYMAFLLIIPGILAISALYPYTAFFSGENKIIVNIKGSLLAFVFIAAADYFLIPRYGIYAASAISSVGYFIYYCYVFVVFQKEARN